MTTALYIIGGFGLLVILIIVWSACAISGRESRREEARGE